MRGVASSLDVVSPKNIYCFRISKITNSAIAEIVTKGKIQLFAVARDFI